MRKKRNSAEIEEIKKLEKELANAKQWYIVTAVSGKEDMVAKDIYDKLIGYNFGSRVQKVEVMKEEKVTKEMFNSDNVPNTLNRRIKGVTWETIDLGNGKFKYEKTKRTLVNKFPGYIFVNCVMDDEVWYVIRNTVNVTGVVGSSGRGVKPTPISDEEYQRMKDNLNHDATNGTVETKQEETPRVEVIETIELEPEKPKIEIDFDIDDIVEVSGAGEATVKSIDFEKQKAIVLVDLFGETQELTYDLKDISKVK